MNLIQPSVEIWKQNEGLQGMYEHIEKCARVCYRSENKGNVSAEKFVKGLISKGHLRPLEFGTIQFLNGQHLFTIDKFGPWIKHDNKRYFANLRVLVESYPDKWENLLKTTAVWDNDVNAIRPTVHWHIGRDIADEFRTHIKLSSLMESTRYVNYNKKGLDFVSSAIINNDQQFNTYLNSIENMYNSLIENGYQPQFARKILPLCTATHLIQCGFISDWENFFIQRTGLGAHPDAKFIADQLKNLIL